MSDTADVQGWLRDRSAFNDLFARQAVPSIQAAAALLVESLRAGGKVLVFGNGGSAAEAQHLASELVGRFVRERAAMPAIALTTDTSALTAIGNDYGFDEVFARQVDALGRAGDVAVAFSTSGRSPNVLRAVEQARQRGMRTIAVTGRRPSALSDAADVTISSPAPDTATVQEHHLVSVHLLCRLIDTDLLGDDPAVTMRPGVVSVDELVVIREAWRAAGVRVVTTNGCFDLVHHGHVHLLEQAAALGDVLVVAVNADASVTRLKGPGRPVTPLDDRLAVLAALRAVSAVVAFDDDTPTELLARLRPDVHAKGADYGSPEALPEHGAVVDGGGEVVLLDFLPGRSTTGLIDGAGPPR